MKEKREETKRFLEDMLDALNLLDILDKMEDKRTNDPDKRAITKSVIEMKNEQGETITQEERSQYALIKKEEKRIKKEEYEKKKEEQRKKKEELQQKHQQRLQQDKLRHEEARLRKQET